jgi:hypothetical protein
MKSARRKLNEKDTHLAVDDYVQVAIRLTTREVDVGHPNLFSGRALIDHVALSQTERKPLRYSRRQQAPHFDVPHVGISFAVAYNQAIQAIVR